MIQIDIEMPKSCADCPLCHCKGKDNPWNYYCSITMDDINIEEWDNIRYNTCPLKEVPTELLTEPCEDCVSRQALIKKAISWEKHFHDSERYVNLTDIQNAPSVKPAENLNKWIPEIERLPEEETDVLICNRNGDIELSRGSYSTEVENDFIWYTSGWRFGKVIAWMPLPQPYKAESEG